MTRKSVLAAVLALAAAAVLAACRTSAGPADLRLGVEAARDGGWEEAAARWAKVLAVDPSSAAAHNNLAVACERLGRIDEARAEYEAALKLAPGDPRIQENFRRFKASLGKPSEPVSREGPR